MRPSGELLALKRGEAAPCLGCEATQHLLLAQTRAGPGPCVQRWRGSQSDESGPANGGARNNEDSPHLKATAMAAQHVVLPCPSP
jgi:hypothetical protein